MALSYGGRVGRSELMAGEALEGRAFDMEKLKQCQAMATAARQRSGKMLAEANAVLAECERQQLANADSQVKALLVKFSPITGGRDGPYQAGATPFMCSRK